VTLAGLLDRGGLGQQELLTHLETLSSADRTEQCLALSATQQERLWDLAREWPVARGTLVPPGAGDATSTFLGRNSLRAFSRFEKRFFRREASVFGFNKHPLGWMIGPGYFAVDPGPDGRMRFDYGRLPAGHPQGWPAVVPNTRFLSRPVYGGLVDEVAFVTADVLVGAAFRGRTPLHSFFVLARG
jgi:hypothetical protein